MTSQLVPILESCDFNGHRREVIHTNWSPNGQKRNPFLLTQNGGTHKKQLLNIKKEIWQHLLANQIKIMVKFLPTTLNVRADCKSRNVEPNSE